VDDFEIGIESSNSIGYIRLLETAYRKIDDLLPSRPHLIEHILLLLDVSGTYLFLLGEVGYAYTHDINFNIMIK
jgi:hypothetical protein